MKVKAWHFAVVAIILAVLCGLVGSLLTIQ